MRRITPYCVESPPAAASASPGAHPERRQFRVLFLGFLAWQLPRGLPGNLPCLLYSCREPSLPVALLENKAGRAPMPFSPIPPQAFQCKNACAPFLIGEALPLPNIFEPEQVQQRLTEHQVSFGQLASAFWTPALTLWTFLCQVLSSDRSCRQAVCHVVLAFA